jgi:hypothetical protein
VRELERKPRIRQGWEDGEEPFQWLGGECGCKKGDPFSSWVEEGGWRVGVGEVGWEGGFKEGGCRDGIREGGWSIGLEGDGVHDAGLGVDWGKWEACMPLGSLQRDTGPGPSTARRRKKQRNESHIPELGVGSENEFSEYDYEEEVDAATMGGVVTDGLKHKNHDET